MGFFRASPAAERVACRRQFHLLAVRIPGTSLSDVVLTTTFGFGTLTFGGNGNIAGFLRGEIPPRGLRRPGRRRARWRGT